MNGGKRALVVVVILILTFGLPIGLQYLISIGTFQKKAAISESSQPALAVISQNPLRFVSIPPEIGVEGSKFIYTPVLEAAPGEEINIKVVSAPEWISFDPSVKKLSGMVPATNAFSISLEAESASGARVWQQFTVTVESAGAAVKGARTQFDSSDPFHPLIVTTTVLNAESGISKEAVLGVNSAEPEATLNFPYLLLFAVLVFLCGVIFTRLIMLLRPSRSVSKTGVIIERGRI